MNARMRYAFRELFEAGFLAAAKEYGADRVDDDMVAAWHDYADEHFLEDEGS